MDGTKPEKGSISDPAKTKRAGRTRANGEGTIWQNANGSWTAQVTAPYGRPSKTFPTRRAAVIWSNEIRREIDTGEYIEPSQKILDDWWEIWIQTYKRTSVSESSLITYRQSKRRLANHTPSLLSTMIARIQVNEVQAAINTLYDSGLSDRTCEMTLVHLRDCLNRAVKDRLIRFNPALDATKPSTHTKAPAVASPLLEEEFTSLIEWTASLPRLTAAGDADENEIFQQPYKDILLFIARTGVRCGEALSLHWEDVTGKTVTIRRSRNNYGVESQTKTRQVRTIPLTPDLVAMLQRRRFAGGVYVFTTRTSTPLEHRRVLRVMTRITGHTIHDLRHTYITRAAQAGINPRVLQSITGHKTLDVLLRVYTHVSEQDQMDATMRISAYCKSTANAAQK